MGLLSHWNEETTFFSQESFIQYVKRKISDYMWDIRYYRSRRKYKKFNRIKKLEKEDQIYPKIKISVGNMVYLDEGYKNNAIIKLETIVMVKNIYAFGIIKSKEFNYNNSSINELEDIINSIKIEAEYLISKYKK